MHIVIAPDSFKGSASAIQVAEAMKRGVQEIDPSITVDLLPMADGGEGTEEALAVALEGKTVSVSTYDALRRKIDTTFTVIHDDTVVIECAKCIGLPMLAERERNPMNASSYGLGVVVREALAIGYRKFIIGLGGSAVNDGGIGLLTALGYTFTDAKGNELEGNGRDLFQVAAVDSSSRDERLSEATFIIANDVTNPLCGKEGATAIYGPQKGVKEEDITRFDEALACYAKLFEKREADEPGAGAAGGLGFAFLQLGGTMQPGAQLIAKESKLLKRIRRADLVLTGEGQSDEQTLFGKAPYVVAQFAREQKVPTVLLSGSVTGNLEALREVFAGVFSTVMQPMSLRDAMENAEQSIVEMTKNIIHFYRQSI